MVDNDFIGLKVMITPLHVKFLMERMRRKVSETDKSTLFRLPRRTRIGIISWRQENMFENMSYPLILPCLQNDKSNDCITYDSSNDTSKGHGNEEMPQKVTYKSSSSASVEENIEES